MTYVYLYYLLAIIRVNTISFIFRSISIHLCGNEHMHIELRARTVCELACYEEHYFRPFVEDTLIIPRMLVYMLHQLTWRKQHFKVHHVTYS